MNENQVSLEIKQWNDDLSPLVGAQVISYDATVVRGDVYPSLVLKTRDGTLIRVEAWRDEECNGAGFLAVLDINALLNAIEAGGRKTWK